MKGSRDLKFDPAKTRGQPVPVSILLPVFFRHPDAPPLPGDSIIQHDSTEAGSAVVPAPDTAQPLVAAKPAVKKPAARTTTKRKTRR
jgi:hypothetical protein